jgi:hypothetical protein
VVSLCPWSGRSIRSGSSSVRKARTVGALDRIAFSSALRLATNMVLPRFCEKLTALQRQQAVNVCAIRVVLASLPVGATPSRLICIGGRRELEGLPRGGVFSLVEAMVIWRNNLAGGCVLSVTPGPLASQGGPHAIRGGLEIILYWSCIFNQVLHRAATGSTSLGARRIWRMLAGLELLPSSREKMHQAIPCSLRSPQLCGRREGSGEWR